MVWFSSYIRPDRLKVFRPLLFCFVSEVDQYGLKETPFKTAVRYLRPLSEKVEGEETKMQIGEHYRSRQIYSSI